MKSLKIASLFLFVFFMAACGDDDPVCVQSDWVGVYTGTEVCDGVSEAATIRVTASGANDILVKVETATTETEYNPITLNGTSCSVDETQSDGTNTIVFEGSLSGETFTLKSTISGAINYTCNLTGTK